MALSDIQRKREAKALARQSVKHNYRVSMFLSG